ncbi:MAG: CHAT domain-containing protein [Saprospiraceae bacterium]|nr:CHAT domain-containing protein [Candidatus Defluviibacterium haderslevense]
MNKIFLIIFLIIPSFLIGQQTDSINISNRVDSLVQEARILSGGRNFDEAVEKISLAKAICLEYLGKYSSQYGTVSFNFGRVLHLQGNLDEAETWYIESQVIREKVLGKVHPEYAWSLNNLATIYKSKGDYQKALPLYTEAKLIFEKTVGKDHADYAMSLSNLGLLDYHMGRYQEAENLYLEAIEIRKKTFGLQHPEYGRSIANLALLYNQTCNYEDAEKLFLKAKSIFNNDLGKDHPDYAKCINNLGVVYFNMANYEKAEANYLEALEIYQTKYGKNNPEYALSLTNLASIYLRLNIFNKAEKYYLEAILIRETLLGKNHPDYALGLINLATCYSAEGQFNKSEKLLLESKAIQETILGKNHHDYTKSLLELAKVYVNIGKFIEAEALFSEAKGIYENEIGGENNFMYLNILHQLGSLYSEIGDFNKAKLFFSKCINKREKLLGKENTEYANDLYSLAILNKNLGYMDTSAHLFEQLGVLDQKIITKASYYLSERELISNMIPYTESQAELFSLAKVISLYDEHHISEISQTCFDNILFYKGFLLKDLNQVRKAGSKDSLINNKINKIKSLERRLANEYSKPISERKNVSKIEEESNEIQKDLARSLSHYNEATRQVKWSEIKGKLKSDEAAIEFVDYQYYSKGKTDSIFYVALLLLPHESKPKFILLFKEKQLDGLLTSSGGRKADYVNELYNINQRGAIPLGVSNISLYDLIWKNIEPNLEGIKTIYYSLSGLLHRINLGAISSNDDKTLADKYHLVELGSTRQLAMTSGLNILNQDAILFGGINFEPDSSLIDLPKNDTIENVIASRSDLDFGSTHYASRTDSWNYLKWTEKEVDALRPILENGNMIPKVLKKYQATEESFKSIGTINPSPRILHLSTHGYFFPDPQDGNKLSVVSRQEESVFKISDHPMIRSGLILSGANYAWKTGHPINEKAEDGILTAYEISQMDLSNTELVILSACETGLGDIKGNEGVYGLQRAFKIAGAKYLIMSLWQVPDRETSEFMITFYKYWLENKLTIPEAFRTTQKEMKDRFINPYQCAGFILVE